MTSFYKHLLIFDFSFAFEPDIWNFKLQIPVGAVVVNPTSKKVIAEAYDLRQAGYALQHAVMVAVDLVAHAQGGGMWSFNG